MSRVRIFGGLFAALSASWTDAAISAMPDTAFDLSDESCAMSGRNSASQCSGTMSLLQIAAQKVRQHRLTTGEASNDPPSLPPIVADALRPLPTTTTPDPEIAAAVDSEGSASDDVADPEDAEPDPNGAGIKTCTVGRKNGCKSMCRWLKLVDKDVEKGTGTSCPLFEWSLKTCGYVAPEDRPVGSDADPLDCTTKIIRKAVFWPELEGMVNSLDGCIQGLPASANETCGVALALVSTEISDLKDEMALKKAAKVARQGLQKAGNQARIAFETKSGEQEAIDALAGNLSRAENISGHYLTEDIHVARDYLDKLGPIPPAREELATSLFDAIVSMKTKELGALNDAITRLNITIAHAEELNLDDVVPPAQNMLAALVVTRSRVLEFQTLVFEANVSLATRKKMPEAIVALKYGIEKANTTNTTKHVQEAMALLDQLTEANNAIKDLRWAVHHGQVVLDSRNKEKDDVGEALRWLNTSFIYGRSLKVTDDATTGDAVEIITKLQYIYGAYVALEKASAFGNGVVKNNTSILVDDAEEAAVALLNPAIEWAYDVQLESGLIEAERLRSRLLSVEVSKENMTRALVEGNSSLAAKAGEQFAIRSLDNAIAVESALGVDAGVPAGEAELKVLRARKVAREHLNNAIKAAIRCLRTREGTTNAVNLLNRSVTETKNVGLLVESDLAYQQMMGLLEQQEAFRILQEALSKVAPQANLSSEAINDSEPEIAFNRSAVVARLPPVNNSEDDGDADFDEHIRVLEAAIPRAKALGVIDPDMEMLLEHIKKMKEDYSQLQVAIRQGNASWISKDGVPDSIEVLTTAISESLDDGLVLGIVKAKKLLSLLVQIQPAMDEYEAALAQGNISLVTVSHMSEAILRLRSALDTHKKLHIKTEIPFSVGEELIVKLGSIKEAFVILKSSIVAGQVALEGEKGEEAAIEKLRSAIRDASAVGLEREMPVATDLLQELIHMNDEHQKMAKGMSAS